MSAQSSSSLPLNMLNSDLLTLKIPDANYMDTQHFNEEAMAWQEVQAAEDYFVNQLWNIFLISTDSNTPELIAPHISSCI